MFELYAYLHISTQHAEFSMIDAVASYFRLAFAIYFGRVHLHIRAKALTCLERSWQ